MAFSSPSESLSGEKLDPGFDGAQKEWVKVPIPLDRGLGLSQSALMKPPAEVNGFVRTVIETVDPALEPVAKPRRFVVKRVQVVGAPLLDGRKSSAKPGNGGRRSPRRSPRTDAPK